MKVRPDALSRQKRSSTSRNKTAGLGNPRREAALQQAVANDVCIAARPQWINRP